MVRRRHKKLLEKEKKREKGKQKEKENKEKKKRVMACFIPFNNRNLDISFFAFRPTVVLVGDLIDALKHFSSCTETLGCVQSCLIQSIHGNMVTFLTYFYLCFTIHMCVYIYVCLRFYFIF